MDKLTLNWFFFQGLIDLKPEEVFSLMVRELETTHQWNKVVTEGKVRYTGTLSTTSHILTNGGALIRIFSAFYLDLAIFEGAKVVGYSFQR